MPEGESNEKKGFLTPDNIMLLGIVAGILAAAILTYLAVNGMPPFDQGYAARHTTEEETPA